MIYRRHPDARPAANPTQLGDAVAHDGRTCKTLHVHTYVDVARLSPYMRRHLDVDGHRSFQLPDLAGRRRGLRDPDGPDDG